MEEQVFKNAQGKTERPLAQFCGIHQKGYSFKLQRMMVHAGCEESFDQAVIHLKELACLDLSKTEIRRFTLLHGSKATVFQEHIDLDVQVGAQTVLSQIDGSMLPILERPEDLPEDCDKRKYKQRIYKEIRLAYALNQETGQYYYQAKFVYKDQIKAFLQLVLDKVGYQKDQSNLYAMGDGAKWIHRVYQEIDKEVHYSIDFYHLAEFIYPLLSDILPSAINRNTNLSKDVWFKCFKSIVSENQLISWIEQILANWEGEDIDKLRQYIASRMDCFDYQTLIKKDLPIGSGLIEGAHKSILQQRLKKSGVGWEFNNIQSMVQLKLLAANDLWDHYWDCQWIQYRVAA